VFDGESYCPNFVDVNIKDYFGRDVNYRDRERVRDHDFCNVGFLVRRPLFVVESAYASLTRVYKKIKGGS
jgi:hypothetical protein